MSAITRTGVIVAVAVVLLGLGCNEPPAPFKTTDRTPKADRDAPFDPPETYPEWAYDTAAYMKPAEDLKPEPRVRPSDPLHYFTNKRVVMIRQPSGYTPEEVPRVAVWWTDDNGFHWQKAGYFGRQQSYFPFEAKDDGDYGIRFVGPGQAPAEPVGPEPERVYHVDTALPEVDVRIEPEQTWYRVGEAVKVFWRAGDAHLVENPVRIGVLSDFSAGKGGMEELQRELVDEGSITYKIPSEALDHELRIRVDATDRAGNVGIAVSHALQVVGGDVGETEAKQEKAEAGEQEKGAEAEDVDRLTEKGEPVSAAADAGGGERREEAAPAAEGAKGSDGDLFAWSGPFFSGKASAESGADVTDERAVAEADELGANVERTPPVFGEPGPSGDEAVWEAVSVVDPTLGNGLLVPLPATVEARPAVKENVLVTAYPWRVLGVVMPTPLRSVGALPAPRQGLDLYRRIEARFLADHPRLRPAGEAGVFDWSFAGGVMSNPSEPQEIGEP